MITTASRTSLRRGSIGRCTRAAAPPRRAQARATGSTGNIPGSMARGTLTRHDDTTVAVTINGADADCAETTAGAAATRAAARSRRNIISILPRSPFRAGQDDPDLGPQVPRSALVVAKQRGHLEPRFLEPLHHLWDVQRSKRDREGLARSALAAALDERLHEPGNVIAPILLDAFDQGDRLAVGPSRTAQRGAVRVLVPRRQIGHELEAEGAVLREHAPHVLQRRRQQLLVEQRLQDSVWRHHQRKRVVGERKMADVAAD